VGEDAALAKSLGVEPALLDFAERGFCVTAPTVYTPGQQSDISRNQDFTGFHYAASAAVVTNFVAFSAFAHASGLENPENTTETTFGSEVTRSANRSSATQRSAR